MSAREILAALSVSLVWGVTFIAIKVGVGETSPLVLAALRFLFAAIPMVFFIAPPKAPAWGVGLYGLLIGVGQFGLLFVAMHQGLSVGLASVVVQIQAFFTIVFARIFLGERPRRLQVIGAVLGFAGMAVIAGDRAVGASLAPLLLAVLAAMFWGLGNVLAKSFGRINTLALVAWSSLAAPAPLLALSVAIDGTAGLPALAHPTLPLVLSVLVISYGATVFGFGVWARLLAHHPAAAVAPFALLVPLVGVVAGALLYGERLTPLEFAGAALVMGGLALTVFGDWAFRRSPFRASKRARYQGDPRRS